MTRKIKRTGDYEISLEIKKDEFVRPPRETQRNWLLNRLLKEFGEDLQRLHEAAKTFVPGGEPAVLAERTRAELGDAEIMEDWQIAVMEAMAQEVCAAHGDVLEIGFGRGIASDLIQKQGVRSHTIVECNDGIVARCEAWRSARPNRDIRLIRGKWQDTIDQLGTYDGIFFHTYPLNEGEFVEYVARSVTFAEHFFDTAAAHLKDGGVFTYLTNETDSLSRSHQRALFERFRSITLRILGNLGVPDDTRDAQWAQETVIVRAEK